MLKSWYPTYIDEVAAQRGRSRDAYQAPKGYVTVNQFDKWPEDALPLVLVISPGMVDRPVKHGDGSYTGSWYIATAIIIEARDEVSTRRLGRRYGAALRTCMMQHRSLDRALEDTCAVTDWLSEDYDLLPIEERRNLAVTRNIFTVRVDNILQVGGPLEQLPPAPGDDGHSPDYGDWPQAPEPDGWVPVVDAIYKED